MTNEPTEPIDLSNRKPITDINYFVWILSDWHKQQVGMLNHLLTIPENTQASLNGTEDEPEKTVTLTEDVLTGFLIGVTAGLAQFDTLPFSAEMVDAPHQANQGVPNV